MKTILLIEQDAKLRQTTTAILEMAHYKVVHAADGKTGMDLLLTERPALVLCAINLPVMSGFEVLYFARKNPACSAIPFVFISDKGTEDEQRRAMNMGADDYLV